MGGGRMPFVVMGDSSGPGDQAPVATGVIIGDRGVGVSYGAVGSFRHFAV